MSSSKLGYLIKQSVSSPSDGSLYVSVKFNFAETSPYFHVDFFFSLSFYFIFRCYSPLNQFYHNYLQMHLRHLPELLCCIYKYIFKPFGSFGVFVNYSNHVWLNP